MERIERQRKQNRGMDDASPRPLSPHPSPSSPLRIGVTFSTSLILPPVFVDVYARVERVCSHQSDLLFCLFTLLMSSITSDKRCSHGNSKLVTAFFLPQTQDLFYSFRNTLLLETRNLPTALSRRASAPTLPAAVAIWPRYGVQRRRLSRHKI